MIDPQTLFCQPPAGRNLLTTESFSEEVMPRRADVDVHMTAGASAPAIPSDAPWYGTTWSMASGVGRVALAITLRPPKPERPWPPAPPPRLNRRWWGRLYARWLLTLEVRRELRARRALGEGQYGGVCYGWAVVGRVA